MTLWDPRDYWCLSSRTWLVHLVVENFHIQNSAFADPKKYSHGPRSSEKAKRTSIAKDCIWFPIVVPKTDTGELFVTPGCTKQRPSEPRNQRAAKLCSTVQSPTKSQKSLKRRLKLLYTWKQAPKMAREKVLDPEYPRKIFLCQREFFDGPQLSVSLPQLQRQQLHRKVSSHQNTFLFWLEYRICSGVSPRTLTLTKTKKCFFVKNDQAQYRKEFSK